ncbi:hypothetical protein HU830_05295 [Lactobacillus sp. DCY120]|uniref:YbaK/aminoacyl-tRNA synthetase-associated domain-containing protein n=1 Tax=Bombilactobacillus apium TaxID=2675299 RepID=A0A850R2K6_9LACO|nr:YbaK/EbsC family protein [Bombilactobacillus apium]NVY96580.1 hypothetical protein [Bombilactobacillus apium]
MPNIYLQRLVNEQLPYEIRRHAPVWQMQDAANLALDCLLVKSLLLHDQRTNAYYLILCGPEEKLKFGKLANLLATSRSQLKFASSEELQRIMQTVPGKVSPLILATASPVKVLISNHLFDQPKLGMHAGTNTETVILSYQSLIAHLNNQKITFYQQSPV